jgi:PAS domain-containing protein
LVFELFKELDDLKMFKDYQTYFQLALLTQHILNDPIGFEAYIGKMKSILEINQVYHKNFAQASAQTTENSNFLIVDANGSRFGRIILFNANLRQLLGWSDGEIKGLSIEDLMP